MLYEQTLRESQHRDLRQWLNSGKHQCSDEMRANIDRLWWDYKEQVAKNEMLTAVLVAAAAKSLSLEVPAALPAEKAA